jgi:GDP/UDP-N,N'-diacetylbacillosamine 2-epimerase (hydrolysing)
MYKNKKICFITGSRAEYGLLQLLIKKVNSDKDLKLQIIATGMHLSERFGYTFKEIEEDGFFIDSKVEMLQSSDSELDLVKAISVGMEGFSKVIAKLKPDLIIVLGDRFEIFAAVISATILRIPIAHIHGGETTEGSFDESFRHSITKMSHLHFTSTEDSYKRVLQLGEDPDRVFNVGAIGVEKIKLTALLSKTVFEKSIKFSLGKKNLLITFHPVTLEKSAPELQFQELLNSLDKLENTNLFFTKSNADVGGSAINKMIDDFVIKSPKNRISFKSMGYLRYLSALQFVDGVIGNSSSGLIEVPSFKIGTVNIGDRQLGRIKPISVIQCKPYSSDIERAIKILFSKNFRDSIETLKNPYYQPNTSTNILKAIKEYPINNVLKKKFYNIL